MTNPEPSDPFVGLEPETRERLQRIMSPAHVAQFVTSADPPEIRWLPFKHLMFINRELVRCCTSPEQEFLNVAVSVRHGKSELISRYLPVWFLLLYPHRQVIIVSYNENKAAEWGQFTRDVFRRWAPMLAGLELGDESKLNWTVKGHRGGCRAVGVGGSLTGIGGDLICVAEGTLVSTPSGVVPVEVVARDGGSVLSYDVDRGAVVTAPVTAGYRIVSDELLDFQFASGARLRCTPDHPIYVAGEGYVPAGLVPVGAQVPRLGGTDVSPLRGGVPHPGLRSSEGRASGRATGVLLQDVLADAPEPNGTDSFLRLRRAAAEGQGPDEVLRVPAEVLHAGRTAAGDQDLSRVRDGVPAGAGDAGLLLAGVCERRPRQADGGRGQSELRGRDVLLQGIQPRSSRSDGTGRKEVRRVWHHDVAARPSLRRGQDEQRSEQPRDDVQDASHRPSQVGLDTVSVVRRVRGESHVVYDLRVEGHHNFFANGLLTHNCIDDPIKNREEADSQAGRNALWGWYGSTLRTRLMPEGTLVLTMARWHEDDLTGRIQNQMSDRSDPWMFIQLPAIAEAPKGADPVEWTDVLGRHEGEALWPERWPIDMLERTRASIDPSDWQALYQQNPTPPEGHLFKVPDWQKIHDIDRSMLRTCRFWDTAATERGGDYTVGALVGMDGDNHIFVLDIQRFQGGPAEVEDRMKATASIDGLGVPIRWEQERAGAGKTVTASYVRLLIGYDASGIRPDDRKEVRARPLASQVQGHNVWLVEASWNQPFLDEARTFPKGRHDDQIDAVVGAFNFLASGGFTTMVTQDEVEAQSGVMVETLSMMAGGSARFAPDAADVF